MNRGSLRSDGPSGKPMAFREEHQMDLESTNGRRDSEERVILSRSKGFRKDAI